MSTNYKLVFGVVLGAALGAAAMQGLHAQAKPKAYSVTETEVLDATAPYPSPISIGRSCRPIAPVAPATKTVPFAFERSLMIATPSKWTVEA